ncbi:LicD family protein [Bacillus sp. CBEL-1]|uniref:LicD family protein n=1 Tax=Bacillus sp. CBEL-1 TaxID=2502980 RepID=UPI001044217E|nr:LicD family protein [Bacillus sp. CBEL-1]TDB55454.1 LicD family protein [Bacillus sp. CBEL-1]
MPNVYGNQGLLRKVQKEQINILNEFDRICKKHNLKYQLFAGTLLGAVRHKGFIPWDDDIDVCMLREDFEKFKSIAFTELTNKYFLQTYETDKEYNRQFIKIRKNDTEFVEKTFIESNIHHGIYIDVFALDNVHHDGVRSKIHRFLLYVFSRIQLLRVNGFIKKVNNPIKKGIAILLSSMLMLVPKIFTDRLNDRVIKMYNRKTKYISHLQNGVNKQRYYKYMMNINDFLEMENIEFENNFYPAPKQYDKILTRLFGDYMKLPPADKREPHHGVVKVTINKERYYEI